MNKFWAFSLLLLMAFLALSCGNSSGRQLQSITIMQLRETGNGQLEFVATGTFSDPPMTVTPLPVMWGLQLYAPPPRNLDYTLTSQPYMLNCTSTGAAAGPVSAIAPSDANAPTSGSWPFSKMTLAYATVKCQ